MESDCFVLSVNINDMIGNIYNLQDFSEYSNLNKDHEVFS